MTADTSGSSDIDLLSSDHDGDPDSAQITSASPWQKLLGASSLYTLVILLVLVIGFSVLEPEAFATTSNWRNIAQNLSILTVLSVGTTFVIVTAGVDLSIGSTVILAEVTTVKTLDAFGSEGVVPAVVSLAVAIATGMLVGSINGFTITKMKVPPLIATLATLSIALGAAQLLNDGINSTSRALDGIGFGRIYGIPYLVLIAALVVVMGIVLLHRSVFGRHTYAIGSNPEAARRAGIPVDRHLLMVYAFAGSMSGFGGWLSISFFTTTSLGGHQTDALQAITAAVLGGTSLFGGVGTIVGTVLGTFIPAVLRNGLIIRGIQPFWQSVAIGTILLVAVWFDQRKRGKRQAR